MKPALDKRKSAEKENVSRDDWKHTAAFSRNPQAPNPEIPLLLVNFKHFNKRHGLHRAKVMFKDPLFTNRFFFYKPMSSSLHKSDPWGKGTEIGYITCFNYNLCKYQAPTMFSSVSTELSISRNTRTASTPSLSQITHLYKELGNFPLLTWGQTLFTGGSERKTHYSVCCLSSVQCFPQNISDGEAKSCSHSTWVRFTYLVQLKNSLFLGLRQHLSYGG